MFAAPLSRLQALLAMRRVVLMVWGALIACAVIGSVFSVLSPPEVYEADKLVHFSVYMLLAAFLPFLSSRRSYQIIGFICLVAMGGGIEIIQSFLPAREGSVFDFAADIAGLSLGWWAGYVLHARLMRFRR